MAELMRDGRLSREEAETHPQRSVITRALGTDPDVDVDAFSVEAHAGDLYILCSDGLTTMVGDEEILEYVEQYRDDLDKAARVLVNAANQRGGEDNITVVIFEIAETAGDVTEITREYPRADAEAAVGQPDEEQTLSELDEVPAVDTMVLPPEQVQEMLKRGEKARAYAEVAESYDDSAPVVRVGEIVEPERRTRTLTVLAILALLLAALAIVVVWGFAN